MLDDGKMNIVIKVKIDDALQNKYYDILMYDDIFDEFTY